MIRNFTIVGGGSAYAPGLFRALLHHAADLDLKQVRLHDIDEAHLDVVSRLCAKMSAAAGTPFEVSAHTDLAEAVTGADAVLHSTRPGGFACRRIDETVPVEHAMPGQETVGPGGFFFALRSVPVALELARTITEHAPQAILLNYTNPTNIVTQVLADHTEVNVIGLCDQSDEDLLAIAEAYGLPPAPISFECVGLNHATWYTDVRFDGAQIPSTASAPRPPEHYDEEHKIRFALSVGMAAERPGYWPNSYLPYYYEPERFVRLSKAQGVRTDAILKKLDSYFEHFAEEAAKDTPDLRHHRGTEGFGDMAVDVVRQLGAATPKTMALNVPNRGLTDAFAEDTVVEARVDLSKEGVTRRPCPKVPDGHAELLTRLEAYQRAAAKVALAPSAAGAVEALALNPLVGTPDRARGLLEAARTRYGSEVPLFR